MGRKVHRAHPPGPGTCLARKSHEPKRSTDFRAIEPLRKRLRRKIGFKQTEKGCWAAAQVCERCRLGTVGSVCEDKSISLEITNYESCALLWRFRHVDGGG